MDRKTLLATALACGALALLMAVSALTGWIAGRAEAQIELERDARNAIFQAGFKRGIDLGRDLRCAEVRGGRR